MNEFNADDFQKGNLVIESDRVLVYSNIFCPLGCRYCFVDDLNFNTNHSKAYLSPEQIKLLGQLPEEVKIIMLGCDTEFFQDGTEALRILDSISTYDKDISIITKMTLDDKLIKEILEISKRMQEKGNILTFSVSMPCFDSQSLWEPNAPMINERLNTLKKVFESGIPTMVAIRPLIPNLRKQELAAIVEITSPYVLGYYSGPLYLKKIDNDLLPPEDIERNNLSISEVKPEWMPEGNTFWKIENLELMSFLKAEIEKSGKKFYNGAAEAITDIRKNHD